MVRIHCKGCNKPTKTKDLKLINKNKRWMLKGTCKKCNSNIRKLLPKGMKPVEGEGIREFFSRLKRAFSGPRKDKMPPSARNLFEKIKDEQINRIDVYRTPLSPIIKGIVSLVKSKEFDELFHLFLVLQTQSGQYLLEKNEVINFRPLRQSDLKENTEGETVAINKEITVNQLFENAQKSMGERFYTYSATQNNCQDFILGLLKSSGLGNQDLYQFIKQDVKDLVPSFFENLADKITDLAGAVNIIQEGEGKGEIHAIEFKKKGYSLDTAKKWMTKHNKPIKVIHEKAHTYWFNQTPKTRYESFIKKKIKSNINLVIGFRKGT